MRIDVAFKLNRYSFFSRVVIQVETKFQKD